MGVWDAFDKPKRCGNTNLVTGNSRKLDLYDLGNSWKVASSRNTSKLVLGFPQKLGASGPAAFGENGFWEMAPKQNMS